MLIVYTQWQVSTGASFCRPFLNRNWATVSALFQHCDNLVDRSKIRKITHLICFHVGGTEALIFSSWFFLFADSVWISTHYSFKAVAIIPLRHSIGDQVPPADVQVIISSELIVTGRNESSNWNHRLVIKSVSNIYIIIPRSPWYYYFLKSYGC